MSAHVTDEELVMLAFAAEASVPGRAEKEAHIEDCIECADRLAAFQRVDEGLADEDSWGMADDHARDARALRSIQAFAEQITREDAEARRLLGPLLTTPAALVWANLPRRKRYRNGGVVRLLTAAAQQGCEREPLHALQFADTAIEVARLLPDDLYPGGAVAELKGSAWKARANALRYLGRFPLALEALERAEREYRRLPHAGVGLAAVKFVRATVHWEQERHDAALAGARESAHAFVHLGQTERYIASRILEATVLRAIGRLVDARAILLRILEHGESTDQRAWVGRAAHGLGQCDLGVGEIASALAHFTRAAAAFQEIGLTTEGTRAEWGIARVFLKDKPAEGIRRSQVVRDAFTRQGMVTDAQLVTLDMLEHFVLAGDTRNAVPLAGDLVAILVAAGKITSALMAAAYLKEAAAARTLSVEKIEYVRQFLRRAERTPDLPFAPPPDKVV